MSFYSSRATNWQDRLRAVNWSVIGLVLAIGLVGVVAQYSVAGESFAPWAWRHVLRLLVAVGVMILIANLSLRTIYRSAYLVYAVIALSLIAVEVVGSINMGAQRWLDLGVIKFQPSELMRIGIVLALARYYQEVEASDVSRLRYIIFPLIIICLPAFLVFRQPDLGTAILLVVIGFSILFLAGVSVRYFMLTGIGLAASFPIVWTRLQNYQQNRILTFFDPERDPLGAGYHIIQSKIGIGSGGLMGKGLGDGTQSRLNFLPEKHTDFIFTIFAEETGFVGSLLLIGLFMALLLSLFFVARELKTHFGRLLVAGFGVSLFLYFFVNLAMVMGLAPVVGVPLPFVSYGGTSLLTFSIAMGLILCVDRQTSIDLGR